MQSLAELAEGCIKRDAMMGDCFTVHRQTESQPARRKLENVAGPPAMSLSVILRKIFEYPLPGFESEWVTSFRHIHLLPIASSAHLNL